MSKFSSNQFVWDAIVIGSGLGGLMAGALLSGLKEQRVLVLERAPKIGGCTHTFTRRKGAVFDVGVHYVSGMAERSFLRFALNRITNNKLRWKELPSLLDRVLIQDRYYALPVRWNEQFEYLANLFQDERERLREFYVLMRRTGEAYVRWQVSELLPEWMCRVERARLRLSHRIMFQSAQSVLDRYFESAELKLLLGCQWQALGVELKECSFGFFSANFLNHADGAYYPDGGGDQIAHELADVIRSRGGEVRTKTEVERIVIESDRATGVVAKGEFIPSRVVVSGAGARNTFLRMMEPRHIPFRERLLNSPDPLSYVMAFIVLKASPLSIGISASNYWLFADPNSAPFYPDDPDLKFLTGLWVGSPSLKREDGVHTIEFATLAPTALVEKWKHTSWRKRGPDYEALKEKIFESMLVVAENHFPGLREVIESYEVSTPLSVEHFVSGAGMGMGISATVERFSLPWARCKTPISNVYLTGSDVFSWGISGALAGGVKTYQMVVNPPSIKRWRNAFVL